ncbi:MAG: hypothetical protein CMA65_00870 [Euryarchaeota archaeon]|jgi:hypothetical protein|nr:hypothetical protein [Euryarchaeota archaeon]|tara:strand:- start:1893 stop:2885 length:993 start_codon:yes stop_codon:yes gene_type:complete
MSVQPLAASEVPYFERIVADSDLDGLCGAAVLKAFRPSAEVIFSHAAAIRSGQIDEMIDRKTVLVDLPFHPNCGWYVDHHLTNRPSQGESELFNNEGGTSHWEATPSAASLAYDLLREVVDMSHLSEMMPIVDALDSGGITKEEFIEDGPVIQFARTCTPREPEYMQQVVQLLSGGMRLEELLAHPIVQPHLLRVQKERKIAEEHIAKHTQIHDRLAICRLDETPLRINGYLVTAWAGDAVDACCIVHGFEDGSLDTPERPALSASFYANSFLKNGQGRFDLSRLATALDPTGGGHANACGCRIQPPGIDSNLKHWLSMWANRETELRIK